MGPSAIVRLFVSVVFALVLYDVTCLPGDVSDAMLLAAMKRADKADSFQSMDDISNYLGELKQYHTVLGRPR